MSGIKMSTDQRGEQFSRTVEDAEEVNDAEAARQIVIVDVHHLKKDE